MKSLLNLETTVLEEKRNSLEFKLHSLGEKKRRTFIAPIALGLFALLNSDKLREIKVIASYIYKES